MYPKVSDLYSAYEPIKCLFLLVTSTGNYVRMDSSCSHTAR